MIGNLESIRKKAPKGATFFNLQTKEYYSYIATNEDGDYDVKVFVRDFKIHEISVPTTHFSLLSWPWLKQVKNSTTFIKRLGIFGVWKYRWIYHSQFNDCIEL